MSEFSILSIPTVLNLPFKLSDILYNCPVCDFEIEIDLVVDVNSFVECDNCNHKIKLKVKRI